MTKKQKSSYIFAKFCGVTNRPLVLVSIKEWYDLLGKKHTRKQLGFQYTVAHPEHRGSKFTINVMGDNPVITQDEISKVVAPIFVLFDGYKELEPYCTPSGKEIFIVTADSVMIAKTK